MLVLKLLFRTNGELRMITEFSCIYHVFKTQRGDRIEKTRKLLSYLVYGPKSNLCNNVLTAEIPRLDHQVVL